MEIIEKTRAAGGAAMAGSQWRPRGEKMASHYRDAAKCLKAVDGGRTTLKTAAYKTQNPPRTVALVSEVRRHRKALETAIAATGPCRWVKEKAGGDAQLLLVAVYDEELR